MLITVDYVKRIIHNSSQKYSIIPYSTLRNKKFTKWKDVHNDVDDLIGESVNENTYKTWLKKNDLDDNRDNKSLYHHLLKKYKSVSKFPKHYNESVNEGKKRYYQQDRVGSTYVVEVISLISKLSKTKKEFVNTLHKVYVYGFNESVNTYKDKKDIRKVDQRFGWYHNDSEKESKGY